MRTRSRRRAVFCIVVAIASVAGASLAEATNYRDAAEPWYFAVSGDSRNYGDVVMPAIAASVLSRHAKFYWHLGDFRVGHGNGDEDILAVDKSITPSQYLDLEWRDFLDHQVKTFGSLPVYLGIGNHDNIPPKTRDDFLATFADYLDTPELRAQRLRDDNRDRAWHSYYHWIVGGVDFINLDNASEEQFDDAQMRWLEEVLYGDTQGRARSEVKSIVVGMHRALPDSKSAGHSMNESPQMTWSGRRVYHDLVMARDEGHKNVYVVASHSHFYLDDVYNTACWKDHVLQGWIAGTAGAVHYPLPPGIEPSAHAMSQVNGSNVFGYLLGAVAPDSKIDFSFVQVSIDDVRNASGKRYTDAFIKEAFSREPSKSVDVHQAVCPAP